MIKNKLISSKKIKSISNKISNNACENFLNSNKIKENNSLLKNENKLNFSIDKEEKNNKSKINCTLHVMPPQISDEDINALFSGLVSIVRRKIELESRAEIININLSYDKLSRELKSKQAECIRLKNEILNLKSQLENKK